jgi:hypothetical protein
MVIEAIINGEFLTREELPAEFYEDIPGASWQENVVAREQIVKTFVLQFQMKMNNFFNKDFQVEYRLAVRSKFPDESE